MNRVASWATPLAAGAAVAAVVAGCNGQSGGTSSGACHDYFDTLVACGRIDPSQLPDYESRFEQLCGQLLALPDVGITPSSLETCLAAIQANGCNSSNELAACNGLAGTLGAGASCATNQQCASGVCNPPSALGCGTCAAPIQAGQSCAGVTYGSNGTQSASCVPGTTCVSGTCVAWTYGGSGAACGTQGSACNPGLSCDATSKTCAGRVGQGAACTSDDACQSPLVCAGAPAAGSTCQPAGGSGAACEQDSDCAAPLGCGNGKCGAITWVAPGQTCDDAFLRCSSLGNCPGGTGVARVCPSVIADGQPCTVHDETSVCDFESHCVPDADGGSAGTCVFAFTGCSM